MNIKILTIAALFASSGAYALESTVGECTGDRLHEIYLDSAAATTQLEQGAKEVIYMESNKLGVEDDTHVTMCRAGQLAQGASATAIGAADVFVIGPDTSDSADTNADSEQSIRYGWKFCWNAVQDSGAH